MRGQFGAVEREIGSGSGQLRGRVWRAIRALPTPSETARTPAPTAQVSRHFGHFLILRKIRAKFQTKFYSFYALISRGRKFEESKLLGTSRRKFGFFRRETAKILGIDVS